jgi:hypothetical protein
MHAISVLFPSSPARPKQDFRQLRSAGSAIQRLKKKAPSTPPFACSYGRNDEMRQEKETGKKKGVQI